MKQSAQRSRSNAILQCGFLIAPLAVFSDSVLSAGMLSAAFVLITFFTALIASWIPRRLPLFLRIVLYSVIGSLVYIPAALLLYRLFPSVNFGIYLPLISVAYHLTAEHDRFLPEKHFLLPLLCQLAGTSAFMILLGTLRELFGAGSLIGKGLFTPPLPFILTPAGGLILLIFAGAAVRLVKSRRKGVQNAAIR